jgi:hypothetical protein
MTKNPGSVQPDKRLLDLVAFSSPSILILEKIKTALISRNIVSITNLVYILTEIEYKRCEVL